MNPNGGPPPAPSVPPIDPLVRPRGLPILVPQNLVATDMTANLPKFYRTRVDDSSRHMERYVECMIFLLITNQGYWLVWFPTTLDGDAYEWYRDHDEGHFRTCDQLLREILTEYRPEVGQSTVSSPLAAMREGREEEITAYIRRFDSVCSQYVGTMLNDDTLKQFIQGFLKLGTIRSVLEKNPRTLVDVTAAAMEVDQLDKDYQRLWRREDELIPQFIPICHRTLEVATVGHDGQAPYTPIEAGPHPFGAIVSVSRSKGRSTYRGNREEARC